jgi:hypothetical protein
VFLQSLVTSHDINGAATAWLFPGLVALLLVLAAVVGGVEHAWGPPSGGPIRLKPDPTGYATLVSLEPFVVKTAVQYRIPLIVFLIAGLSRATG